MILLPMLLLVAGYLQASVDALDDIVCSTNCPKVHPQQQFCNADNAFKVQVVNSDFVNRAHEVVSLTYSSYVRYQATVLETLKGSSELLASPEEGEEAALITFYSPSGFACSISTLRDEETYLVAGKTREGMMVITDCDGLAIRWSQLTDIQKAGVKGRYEEFCNSCRINSAATTMWYGGELADMGEISGFWGTRRCFYNPIPSTRYGGVDCETAYTYCVPVVQDGGEGGVQQQGSEECTWEMTAEYQDCFQAREDDWFLREKGAPAFTCRSQCADQLNRQLRYTCFRETKKLERQGHKPC